MKRLLLSLFLLCTLMVQAQDGKIKFAVLADTHLGAYASASADLRAALEDINAQSDIDFIIIAGDITEFGTDDEIMAVKKELEINKKTLLFVPGNHDTNWSESGCTTFNKVMGGSQFRYMHDGVLFLGISSGPYMRMGPCQAPREDIEWLAKNLKETPEDTPVVFVCHSPLTLTAIANADQIIDLLKTRNIQFVIAGHYHVNSATDFEGIPGFLCRSTLRTK
ncbi:MAG: metallophosphoesterase, partial [Flavobacteriales bacterium]|nr:metallophosphoesterase [Flavobacteriales bacterium]